jgi:hypothetical protein
MSQPFDPKRRALSAGAALALLGFPVITISGCGGGGSPGGPSGGGGSTPTPSPGDAVGSISANHGHTAVVSAAELQAGNALSLNIRGNATHDHRVDLSAAEVVEIRGRQRVSKSSSVDDAHDHTVTFN